MPRIGKKDDEKIKKVTSVSEKKENAKKVVGTEKGKAVKEENKTPKSKTRKTATEKLVAKKVTTANKNSAKKPIGKKATSAIAKNTATSKTITPKTVNKKSTSKKVVTSVTTVKLEKIVKPKRKTKKEETPKTYLPEYYDLPYRYNDTIVKILYQTPKRIFVYWDISDSDRQRYIRAFGEDFFEKTYPVLLVHNEELNYTFEVPINDFANSWYLDIKDPKTKYVVQLGRKFREVQKEQIDYNIVKEEKINLQNDFIYITDSNKLETPNDRILFEKVPEKIIYRNVKTGEIVEKEVKQVLRKLSKTYNNPQVEELYRGLYKEFYGEEILIEEMDISNPSSGGSSSFIK